MSASNSAARQAAALSGRISDIASDLEKLEDKLDQDIEKLELKIEHDLEKLEDKLDTISGKMYKHFADAQIDSLRLKQVTENVNSVKSTITYATRTIAGLLGTALFGVIVAIISSGIGGN